MREDLDVALRESARATPQRTLVRPDRVHDIADVVLPQEEHQLAVPEDGALLLVEWALPEGNAPSAGKFADVMMMLMTGGKERTVEEYSHLLGQAGFRLNQVTSTSSDLNIIEALPD